jgi:hypothetical protein
MLTRDTEGRATMILPALALDLVARASVPVSFETRFCGAAGT